MQSINRMIRDAFLASERIEQTGEQTPTPARSVATVDQVHTAPDDEAERHTW